MGDPEVHVQHQHAVQVQVPVGVSGGTAFELTYQNRTFRVSCPPGARPGDTITVRLQVAKGAPPILRPAPRAATRYGVSWMGGRPTNVRYSDTDPQYVGDRALSFHDGGDDLDRLDPDRQRPFWPFHLFGCCSYTSPDTKRCVWFPTCFPMAVLLPGILYGQNYTLFADEAPLCSNETYRSCCGCGTYGWLRCCLASVLTSCTHGLCWPMMCALTVVQRKNIIQKFGIDGRRVGKNVSWCESEVWEGVCVPCALTQEYEFLRLQRVRIGLAPMVREISAPMPNYESMYR